MLDVRQGCRDELRPHPNPGQLFEAQYCFWTAQIRQCNVDPGNAQVEEAVERVVVANGLRIERIECTTWLYLDTRTDVKNIVTAELAGSGVEPSAGSLTISVFPVA
ncbi:hypothetical protein [Cupriavidus sp. H39]|uniref:hypothetical protein n=1 Tax=Cupriavidus sp. H39 TaxID=3401635 RepID=UPI003D021CA6